MRSKHSPSSHCFCCHGILRITPLLLGCLPESCQSGHGFHLAELIYAASCAATTSSCSSATGHLLESCRSPSTLIWPISMLSLTVVLSHRRCTTKTIKLRFENCHCGLTTFLSPETTNSTRARWSPRAIAEITILLPRSCQVFSGQCECAACQRSFNSSVKASILNKDRVAWQEAYNAICCIRTCTTSFMSMRLSKIVLPLGASESGCA